MTELRRVKQSYSGDFVFILSEHVIGLRQSAVGVDHFGWCRCFSSVPHPYPCPRLWIRARWNLYDSASALRQWIWPSVSSCKTAREGKFHYFTREWRERKRVGIEEEWLREECRDISHCIKPWQRTDCFISSKEMPGLPLGICSSSVHSLPFKWTAHSISYYTQIFPGEWIHWEFYFIRCSTH